MVLCRTAIRRSLSRAGLGFGLQVCSRHSGNLLKQLSSNSTGVDKTSGRSSSGISSCVGAARGYVPMSIQVDTPEQTT